MTALSRHKTKIVATIGPASSAQPVMEKLLLAGVNVFRLNFSHADFDTHAENIQRIRAASEATGKRVAIMADLPGPKMRVGEIPSGPVELSAGDDFCLTSDEIAGDASRVSMSFEPLPRVVKPDDTLFLNDGIIQLRVREVIGNDVYCKVVVGGTLSSKKGLNLPGIDLGISVFTDRDRECLEFALEHGVDAVSQSFVETAADIRAVRTAAARFGRIPFIIAKIERLGAVEHFEEILAAADGVMIARGDLGVELPVEDIAVTQKRLIAMANRIGKPVITATQMLESMTQSRLPTRAEATDVANAILDGTDCVMLSAESAVGKFPVDAVAMLGKIAASAEGHRCDLPGRCAGFATLESGSNDSRTLLAERVLSLIPCDFVLVPTVSGNSARAISRARSSVWILAVGNDEETLQGLCFSYGVEPVFLADEPENWKDFARSLADRFGLPCRRVILSAGPSCRQPEANHRIELMELTPQLSTLASP